MSRGSSRGDLETGKGTMLSERGPHNSVPVDNYPSGDGKSYVYEGSGYYVPSERSWVKYHEYRSIPPSTRRDAILFESEEQWRKYQSQRDSRSAPGGITFTGVPQLRSTTPLSALLPYQRNAWTKPWSGSGFFVAPTDKWIHEQTGPGIPSNAYLFYNEEDWIKFRYQVENPSMKTT
ncbi:uncharacterized protein [Haliotis asinina]|uniref:uncharacterized protein n=1 Tax=Haliotis asinina TaxID=109174 RepID=UPI0035318455